MGGRLGLMPLPIYSYARPAFLHLPIPGIRVVGGSIVHVLPPLRYPLHGMRPTARTNDRTDHTGNNRAQTRPDCNCNCIHCIHRHSASRPTPRHHPPKVPGPSGAQHDHLHSVAAAREGPDRRYAELRTRIRMSRVVVCLAVSVIPSALVWVLTF